MLPESRVVGRRAGKRASHQYALGRRKLEMGCEAGWNSFEAHTEIGSHPGCRLRRRSFEGRPFRRGLSGSHGELECPRASAHDELEGVILVITRMHRERLLEVRTGPYLHPGGLDDDVVLLETGLRGRAAVDHGDDHGPAIDLEMRGHGGRYLCGKADPEVGLSG